MNEQLPTSNPDVSDLVRVDTMDRARRPDNSMMKTAELDQIAAHEGQIRDGLQGFDTVELRVATDEAAANRVAEVDGALDTLSSLMSNRKTTLDGPTLTKAGLSHTRRLELGFNSLEEMQTAASRRQTEKQTSAAAQAAERKAATLAKAAATRAANKAQRIADARQAATDAYKDQGTAQAEAWKQDVAMGRGGALKRIQRTDRWHCRPPDHR